MNGLQISGLTPHELNLTRAAIIGSHELYDFFTTESKRLGHMDDLPFYNQDDDLIPAEAVVRL